MTRLLFAAAVAALALPKATSAQRVSAGAGAGIAASTNGSLSEGRTGPIVMGQVTTPGPVGVGLEVDARLLSGSSVLIATAHLQFHVPSTPVFLAFGAGVGSGDPDRLGTITGVAARIGAAIDLGSQASSLTPTVFANGFLVYSPSRSLQMVEAGLAITRR